MTEQTFKKIHLANGSISYWRRLSDGRQESVPPDHPDFVRWLAEGNEPLPADEPQ